MGQSAAPSVGHQPPAPLQRRILPQKQRRPSFDGQDGIIRFEIAPPRYKQQLSGHESIPMNRPVVSSMVNAKADDATPRFGQLLCSGTAAPPLVSMCTVADDEDPENVTVYDDYAQFGDQMYGQGHGRWDRECVSGRMRSCTDVDFCPPGNGSDDESASNMPESKRR